MSTFRRPIDNAESLRSTRRSLGDGTVTGRSRLAMPPANRARGTGFQRLTGPPGVSGVSTGETITVAATSVAISTTPTLVTFTEEVGERAGFFFTAPSVDIQPTFGDAYYDIQVSIDRGGYSGTVAVEVLRGNDVVWGPTFDPYWNNPTHPVSAKGRLVDPAISPWRVRLTGSEAGTVSRVVAQVELVDRPRLTPPLLANIPEPPLDNVHLDATFAEQTGSLSSPAPNGTQVGDGLLFIANVDAQVFSSVLVGYTPPSAVSPLYDPGILNSRHAAFVGWKVADLADQQQTREYTWAGESGQSNTNIDMAFSIIRFPAETLPSVSGVVSDYQTTTNITLTTPAATSWVLGVAIKQQTSTVVSGSGEIFVTPSVDLLFNEGLAARGRHQVHVLSPSTSVLADFDAYGNNRHLVCIAVP